MGFLKGLVGIAVSPVTIVKKTIDRLDDDDIEAKDVLTLGLTKVVDGIKDTAEEIEEDFEE
jgi:hypothetical protein